MAKIFKQIKFIIYLGDMFSPNLVFKIIMEFVDINCYGYKMVNTSHLRAFKILKFLNYLVIYFVIAVITIGYNQRLLLKRNIDSDLFMII